LDGGQEVGDQLVLAGGDAAEVSKAAEHVLDSVAYKVQERAEAAILGRFRLNGMFGTAPRLWIC
jgi:hypothetical protein